MRGLLTDSKLISRYIFNNNNTLIGMVGRDVLIMTLIRSFNNPFRIKVTQGKRRPRPTIRETNLARAEAGEPLLGLARTKEIVPTIIWKLTTSLEEFLLTLSMDTLAVTMCLRFNMINP